MRNNNSGRFDKHTVEEIVFFQVPNYNKQVPTITNALTREQLLQENRRLKEQNEQWNINNNLCKNTISRLQSEAQVYQQNIRQHELNYEKQQQTIRNLQSQEQSQQREIERQKATIQRLEKKSQGDDQAIQRQQSLGVKQQQEIQQLKSNAQSQQGVIEKLQTKGQDDEQIIQQLTTTIESQHQTNDHLETKVKQLEREVNEMKSKIESLQRVEVSRSEGKIINSFTTTSLQACREKLMKIRDTYCFDFFDELTLNGNEQELAFCLLVRNVFESGGNTMEIKDCFENYISVISPYVKDQSKLEEVRNMFEEYQRIVKDARELNQIVRNMSSPTFHLVWGEFDKQYHDVTSTIKLPAGEVNQRGILHYQLSPALTYGSENNISEKATFLELTFQ